MINCPNCGRQLNDGALFCDGCGRSLAQMINCPNCGLPTRADTPFCQHCGAQTGKVKKGINIGEMLSKIPKKLIAIGVAVVALAVAAAIVLPLIFASGGGVAKSSKSVVVIQDEGMYFYANGNADLKEITDEYVEEESLESVMGMIKNTTVITPDGKRLFYTENNDGSSAVELYYKNPTKEKDSGTKIASNVTAFMVNAKGTKVIYLAEGTLYSSDLEDKEKLASSVESFYASDDLSVVYYKSEDTIYRKEADKEKEKIVGDNCSFAGFSDDFKTVFYQNEDSDLYKKTVGEKKIRVASNVSSYRLMDNDDVYAKTEDGKLYILKANAKKAEKLDENVYGVYYGTWDGSDVYYLKDSSDSEGLMQYVDDDMKESDAALTEPVEPEWPDFDLDEFQYPEWPDSSAEEYQYPNRPYSYQYDSDEEYEAAYAEYEAAKEKATTAWQAAKDAYYEQYDAISEKRQAAKDEYYELYDVYEEEYDAYRAKLSRDELRESLKDYEASGSARTLCYYNGKETKEILKNVSGRTAYAAEKPSVVVSTVDPEGVKKVKLSEVSYAYEVYEAVNEAMKNSASSKIIVGESVISFDAKDKEQITLATDASYIYYISGVNDEGEGTLCKAKIGEKKVEKAEKIDKNVSVYELFNGELHYITDLNDEGMGEYRVDGVKIAEDVSENSVRPDVDNKTVYFYTDVDEDEEYGTLNMYKDGKAIKIAEEVSYFQVVGNGDIYMLCDYDSEKYEGDLFVYTGGKEPKALEEDVTYVSSILTTEERLELGLSSVGVYYGW